MRRKSLDREPRDRQQRDDNPKMLERKAARKLQPRDNLRRLRLLPIDTRFGTLGSAAEGAPCKHTRHDA